MNQKWNKFGRTFLAAACLVFGTTACSGGGVAATNTNTSTNVTTEQKDSAYTDATQISLSDSGVTVDGKTASTDATAAVYTGAPIIYYEAGHDDTYGEGEEADGHTAEEAAKQTVVTITQPGTYVVSGTLSAGQLAVDLGEDAETDPDAVVTLVLNGVDITCDVAPAVIFYNVYECGSADTETATQTVDTSGAGANVILADGSTNVVNGAYVAKIYKEGTTDKLYKFDGAFYSKMSMNLSSDGEGTGSLAITGANEGLDSELHLTINSGDISITSQDDGINTNEDGVSVTTINGGNVSINAGLGSEGDGIDSNGWLVINGGNVYSIANPTSGDGGLDSDKGIYLNGGTVVATGNRTDEIEAESTQQFVNLVFAQTQSKGAVVKLTDADGNTIYEFTSVRDFTDMVLSLPELAVDTTYHVYVNGVQQQYTGTGLGGGMNGQPGEKGGQMPTDGEAPEMPAEGEAPENQTSGGPMPGGQTNDGEKPQRPDNGQGGPQGGPGGMNGENSATGEASTEFQLTADTHVFNGVAAAETTETNS